MTESLHRKYIFKYVTKCQSNAIPKSIFEFIHKATSKQIGFIQLSFGII